MPQSLNKTLIHIVFSTKHRQHLIVPEIEQELHGFLGAVCKELDCPPFQIGGFTNHIHILCGLSRKIKIMDLMEELKGRSSRWVKTKGSQYSNFYWQNGYAVFSVTPYDRMMIVNYIKKQHAHHSKKSFEDECRVIFKENDIEFDERYVWG